MRLPLARAATPTAALTAALAADLALNRLAAHVAPLPRWAELAGLFAFHLAGALALVVAALGMLGIVRDARLLPPAARLWFALVGALFLPLSALALAARLPESLAPSLATSFAACVLGLVIAMLLRRGALAQARPRESLGFALLAAPVLLHALWVFLDRLPPGWLDRAPPVLFRAGQVLATTVAPAAALLLARDSLGRLLRGAPLAAALATAAGLLGGLRHPLGLARVLRLGFGLALPATPLGRATLVLAAALFVGLVAGLARRPGRDRACALGLAYLALAGYQLQQPYQLLAVQAAFVLLLRAAAWPSDVVEVGPERWDAYARAVAAALGAGDPVVVGDETSTITRIRRGGALPLDVRIVRRGQDVREVGVAVGPVPTQPPPYTLGGEIRPRDVKLPRAHDAEALGLALPPELEGGWLGVWPQEAIMFRTFPEAAFALRPVSLAAIAAEEDAALPAAELVEFVRAVERLAASAEVRE